MLFLLIVTLLTVEANVQWMNYTERFEATSAIIPQSGLVTYSLPSQGSLRESTSFVAITTGPDNGGELEILFTKGNPYPLASTFNFSLKDQQKGSKTRVELCDCFSTNASLKANGVDPASPLAQQYAVLDLLQINCSGAPSISIKEMASTYVTHYISYEVYIPSDFPVEGTAIMGQFHGRPDKRVFRSPNHTVYRFSTEKTYDICCHGVLSDIQRYGTVPGLCPYCNEGVVVNAAGNATGWTFQEGGYPPLTFGYSFYEGEGGWFYVLARSDDRVMSPKADCGLNPAKSGDWPSVKCNSTPHEYANGLWRSKNVPRDKWLNFTWSVTWSKYNGTDLQGGDLLANGTIAVTLDNNLIVNWTGPVGRADDGRLPYFKIGMYNPSGDPNEMSVNYRNFKQKWWKHD
eukprot:m.64166 g.64166  ORF g.64166 m.64166 type:complete len:403 (-) comp11627_c0_seq1:45-1253(-)